jgi:hypothetical protein
MYFLLLKKPVNVSQHQSTAVNQIFERKDYYGNKQEKGFDDDCLSSEVIGQNR